MPEEAAREIRRVVDGLRDETTRLVRELRETRRELTPRPLRRLLQEVLLDRAGRKKLRER